jgi:hypothetical protein
VILEVAIGLAVVVLGGTILLTRFSLQRLAFVAVCLLAFTISWNGVRIGGGAFGDGFLALAFIGVVAHVIVDRRAVPIPPWLLATAGLMLLAALITAIFPPSMRIENITELQFNQQFVVVGVPITAIGGARPNTPALVKFEIALLLLPTLFSVVATTPWRINRLLDVWTIGAAANALVGVLDRAGFHALSPLASNGDRSAGLTIQPNYLALTAVLALPLALRWVGRSRRSTVAGWTVTAILLGGEYVTGSRDGNVAAGVVVVLSIAVMPRVRSRVRYVLPALGVLLVVVLAFTHAGDSILKQMRLGGATTSTSGSNYERSIAKHVAEQQISSRPIAGVGFSTDNDAQNIYLQILAAGGAIAMIGFLLLFGGLASCVRRAMSGPVREEAIAIGVCLTGWLVNGYYDSQLADKYLYVLPGILIACARVKSARSSPAPVESIDFATLPVLVPAREPIAVVAMATPR